MYYDYLKFYRTYPQIAGTVSAQLQPLLPKQISADDRKVPTASAQLIVPPQKLINSLSYSQSKLLVDLDEDLMRAFAATWPDRTIVQGALAQITSLPRGYLSGSI